MPLMGFARRPERVLCLGAHSDDIEIGCGGTVLRLIESYPCLAFRWVVFGATGDRVQEACRAADLFLSGAGERHISVQGFRDGFFPHHGLEIKEHFEMLKREFAPDLIFTHYRHDAHQDHRVISELTWNTFRNHLILEYEIPKYDGDLGSPSFFVQLDPATCAAKIEHLLNCFATQRGKHWFTADLFYAMLRLRGMEANAASTFAEAFYCRKLVF
ncbi:MAG: putative LmbE-like protein [Chloroflexi bacterium]|nr:putative LmbE-like protein [Chloroflexota bacterium]